MYMDILEFVSRVGSGSRSFYDSFDEDSEREMRTVNVKG
jgi:hypothetical protein